ncbi:hypothetical protein CDAR_225751 [Caerostris darwini]|uniref:Uncharacterized protein n=1 Tax=Caerostris darwini TaxID=1538125 RepID=A0AAV4TZU0_9ARAC|nr:hypothetical protein CDAR_225751 [Caerostris darwini]
MLTHTARLSLQYVNTFIEKRQGVIWLEISSFSPIPHTSLTKSPPIRRSPMKRNTQQQSGKRPPSKTIQQKRILSGDAEEMPTKLLFHHIFRQ